MTREKKKISSKQKRFDDFPTSVEGGLEEEKRSTALLAKNLGLTKGTLI